VYVQNLGATLGIVTPAGVTGFVTQNLGNTRSHAVAAGTRQVANNWTLSFGGDTTRTLIGGTELKVSARHQDSYTELPPDCNGSCGNSAQRGVSFWTVNASVLHNF